MTFYDHIKAGDYASAFALAQTLTPTDQLLQYKVYKIVSNQCCSADYARYIIDTTGSRQYFDDFITLKTELDLGSDCGAWNEDVANSFPSYHTFYQQAQTTFKDSL